MICDILAMDNKMYTIQNPRLYYQKYRPLALMAKEEPKGFTEIITELLPFAISVESLHS